MLACLHGPWRALPAAATRRRWGATLNVNFVCCAGSNSLGSALYGVHTRVQAQPPLAPGEPLSGTLFPADLLRGPSTDAWMVKWSYF